LDEEGDVKSIGVSNLSDYSGDEPSAFDNYDIDEAAVHRRAFVGRLCALVDDNSLSHTHTWPMSTFIEHAHSIATAATYLC
jgi:hypothetical protein